MRSLCPIAFTVLCAVALTAQASLAPEQKAKLPLAAAAKVDFTKDVKPIFDAACVKCHGKGKSKGSFSLETRESFLKGGDGGTPITSGKSADSLLIELVSGLNPDNVMPQKGSRLKPEQISILRAWIDQGAMWPDDVTFKKAIVANLHPRKVALPTGSKSAEPVDRLLEPYFAQHNVKASKIVEDRLFARRVYLDVIGLLPSPKELDAFLADQRADKRERLIDRLLSDNLRYAEHWLSFWNDLLRNDYRGTGYIDGGRKQISSWLFSALLTNMSYNQFVARLIDPTPESEGFVNGIVWRGTVNAAQRPVMQAAQSIGQVFMGVNLKCASCHDSFINDYTLADSYGLAAIYATNDLEIAECDKPTGKFSRVKFLYPELGDIDPTLPRAERTKRLAQILTSREDGRLTRTIVNRLWAKFMGRGLIEPVDEMDNPSWHQDMLDWLAEDFADSGYDLKHAMKRILVSRAYQMPAVNLADSVTKDYVFTGPAIRRMSAEQFRDALGELTGVWFEQPAARFDVSGGKHVDLPAAKWIWSTTDADKKAPAETVYLRKTVFIAALPEQAGATISCDNSFTLWVNGQKVASGKDFGQPTFANLKPYLKVGENVIAVAAVNNTPDNKPPGPRYVPQESDANPAGFIFAARLQGKTNTDLVSDSSWVWSTNKAKGWETPGHDAATWEHAGELGSANVGPWNLQSKLEQSLALAELHGQARASMVAADPLMLALGRPNREQITTVRQSSATTLQALELTNGKGLDEVVKQGASKLIESGVGSSRDLVSTLFRKSLGRPPASSELKLAADLVGSPARREGVEDLLWSIAMLPEFQLIY